MSGLNTFNRLLVAKIESDYGTDPTADGTNAIRVSSDLACVPLQAELVERDQLLGHAGRTTAQILAAKHRVTTFSCELTSSGVAGTPPAFGIFLRACGMAETIVAGTSVTYTPTDDPDAHESVALLPFIDGVRLRGLGNRGTFSISGNRNGNGLIANFTFQGLYEAATDTSNPTPTYGNHAVPTTFEAGNTDNVSMLTYTTPCVESFSYDYGNTITLRNLANCSKTMRLTSRSGSGSINIKTPTVTEFDLYGAINSRTTGLISIRQIDVSGGYCTVNVNHACLNPTEAFADVDGVQHVEVGFDAIAPTALSDFSLVFS